MFQIFFKTIQKFKKKNTNEIKNKKYKNNCKNNSKKLQQKLPNM